MGGNRTPANGAFVASLEATARHIDGKGLICPKVVTGKPNDGIVDIIRKEHDIPEEELSKFIMIGDNPTTDISLGNKAGISTALTMTGVVKDLDMAENWIK